MKFVCSTFIVLGALLSGLLFAARAQDQPNETSARGFFLKTRKDNPLTSPAKKRPPPRHKTAPPTYPLGLGYSLYQRDAEGRPVRVETKDFRAGDALRLVIEANAAGYLYVFGTTNGAEPTMIFPNVRLNEGDNRIKAHVPYEIPSSTEANPRRRWFEFSGGNATEQVYLIITRAPLPEVPIGARLLAQCPPGATNCEWQPPANIWRQVSGQRPETFVSQTRPRGEAQSSDETAAISRKLGLPPDAPAPAMVKMNKVAKADRLVTMIELTLK